MRKRLLGVEHPDILLSMGNLASIYGDQGKWNEAEQIEIQVMNIKKKLLGIENPDTLLSMEKYSLKHGKYSRNIQVMEIRQKLLGVPYNIQTLLKSRKKILQSRTVE